MRWQDIEGTWWTVLADVAKNGRSHRVPLSPQAVTILDRLRKEAKGAWVSGGWTRSSPRRERQVVVPLQPRERARLRKAEA